MTLIRGLNGLCPCPRCLVPRDQLYDLQVDYPLRTVQHTKDLHNQARDLVRKEDKNQLFKNCGLRPIEVSHFLLAIRTIHSMLAPEQLHARC
jgi:hypothetical protein